MEIWESKKDWGGIMRKAIIIIEILILILLLVSFPGEKTEAMGEEEAKYFLMTATAYYPGPECCHPYADGLTATGAKAGRGCIAIDPENGPLKLGQKVFVEGYGYGICNDVGEAITEWELDLCYETLEEAKGYGRKLVKVYIIEK